MLLFCYVFFNFMFSVCHVMLCFAMSCSVLIVVCVCCGRLYSDVFALLCSVLSLMCVVCVVRCC